MRLPMRRWSRAMAIRIPNRLPCTAYPLAILRSRVSVGGVRKPLAADPAPHGMPDANNPRLRKALVFLVILPQARALYGRRQSLPLASGKR